MCYLSTDACVSYQTLASDVLDLQVICSIIVLSVLCYGRSVRCIDVPSMFYPLLSVGCNHDLVMNGPTTENCVKKDEHLCELQMLIFLSAYSLDLYQQLHCSKKNGYLAGQWSPRLFHCECLTLSGDCVLRQSHL